VLELDGTIPYLPSLPGNDICIAERARSDRLRDLARSTAPLQRKRVEAFYH